MSFSDYLLSIKKLNNIGRWASDFMHMRASVAEHSFSVVQIAQLLGIIEEKEGNKIDWAKLYKKALNHDVSEAFTGDILSHVKHRTEKMKQMVEEIEELIAEDMVLSSFDEGYRATFRDILFDGKDTSLEGRILKYADNIDALLECLYEKNLGNRYPFEEKYNEILDKLRSSELMSVKTFLKEVLPEMERLA